MALLELRDIGKIYISNNNVAVGIRGVNLSFNSGEFVAITGKSGSGKSTLLNVISGMDTYEEGELLIDGDTTSHYIQSDWEEYRQKYISFIFQDYNIIDNFTVLQNVELALMSTYDPIERRRKALELINRVGLSKAIHQKGSKLSGGQKQRTVIARALAKDSPIILADEPTGNLDSETSKEIIDLLYEVSKNKLVIIVTHNFEQVEMYATRHIRVYDGAIESDQELTTRNDYEEQEEKKEERKSRDFLNGLTLGRIMFFSKPKLTIFLCLLMLVGIINCFFTIASSSSAFDLFKTQYMFTDVEGRVVVVKQDGTTITDTDLEKLKNETGATSVVHYDRMFDTPIGLYGVNLYSVINEKYGNNIEGRYPQARNEVFVYLPISVKEYESDFVGTKICVCGLYYDVVGCKFFYDNTKKAELSFTEEGFEALNYAYCFMNEFLTIAITSAKDEYSISANLYCSFDLPEGKMAIFGDQYKTFMNDDPNSKVTLMIGKSYTSYVTTNSQRKNITKTLTEEDIYQDFTSYDVTYDNEVYVSYNIIEEMAKEIMHNSYRQASLIYSSNRQAKRTASSLSDSEYIAVYAKTTVNDQSLQVILNTILGVLSLFWLIASMIFLSFFINICTSKSVLTLRPDMSIMRSMGIKVKTIKVAMYVRMILALIPGYIILGVIATFVYMIPSTNAVVSYMHFWGYLFIILGTLFIAFFVAKRHIKKLFKVSVKTSLVGGGEQ